jgi:hypothetical protein
LPRQPLRIRLQEMVRCPSAEQRRRPAWRSYTARSRAPGDRRRGDTTRVTPTLARAGNRFVDLKLDPKAAFGTAMLGQYKWRCRTHFARNRNAHMVCASNRSASLCHFSNSDLCVLSRCQLKMSATRLYYT